MGSSNYGKKYPRGVGMINRIMATDFETRSLQLAIQHQQAGRLAQAETVCREIVANAPANADALHMLGVLALQTRQFAAALDWLGQAVALQPTNAICQNNLGSALKELGKLGDAVVCFERAVQLKPDFAAAQMNLGNAYREVGRLEEGITCLQNAAKLKPNLAIVQFNLGNALKDAGHWEEAVGCFQRAVGLQPNYAEAYCGLGTALKVQGKLDEAIASGQRAIMLKPDYANGHFALGNAFKDKKQLEEAIGCYRLAVALKADVAEYHLNLGNALFDKGEFGEAVSAYEQVLALQPEHPQALFNLGNALRESGRFVEAIARYQQALALAPEYAEIHNNLGQTWSKRGQEWLEEAILSFRRAIALKPGLAAAHSNLGNELVALGQSEEARLCLETAGALEPDCADTHMMLGMIYLLQGDLLPGWREYEWRWKSKSLQAAARVFPKPRWEGGDLAGRTLLVHAEQGLGDTLQFSRYLGMAAERGGRVIVECQTALIQLLQRSWPQCVFVAKGSPLPAYDCYCPLLSLPLMFQTTQETIPAGVPYLRVDAEKAARWRDRLAGSGDRLKVGLVWAGNKDNHNDHNRSIALSKLVPLGGLAGVDFYSLQKGEATGQVQTLPPDTLRIIDLTVELGVFDDTAALLVNLDLVISVDTAVAHLAGALGRPVWTLLTFSPDWRWLSAGSESRWYPTMRLFRQPKISDWERVIPEVVEALRELADQRA